MAVLAVYSQEEGSVDSETTKQLTREQRKEQSRLEAEATAKLVDSMVQNKRFVLEAEYLGNQTGDRIVVNYRLNFIIVDSARVTFQYASNTAYGGLNGMGGLTTEGPITKFEVNKVGTKYPSYVIHIIAMTHIGSTDIFFNISRSSNSDATISNNSRGKLVFYGNIVPPEKSRIYKAMSR